MQPSFGGLVFKDDQHWQTLAACTKYPLPNHRQMCDLKPMRLWLTRVGKTENWHRERFGSTLDEFIQLNPHWPLRAWVGLLLEATVGAH